MMSVSDDVKQHCHIQLKNKHQINKKVVIENVEVNLSK